MDTFYERLINTAKARDFNVKDNNLSMLFGLTPSTFAMYRMHPERRPVMEKAISMALILGVCVEWLMEGTEPMYPQALS